MAISPHSSWNGTAGGGFSDNGGGGVSIPVDPTRTAYKPAAKWMIPQNQPRFTDTYKLQVSAFAKGGIDSVTFYCEGVSETVSDLTLFSDGNFGYECTIDTSSDPDDGELEIYAEVNPTSGTAQKRVLGPLNLWSNSNGTLDNTGTVFYIDTSAGNSVASGTFADPYDSFDNLVAGEASGLPTPSDWSGIEIRLKSATGNDFRLNNQTANTGAVVITYAPESQSRRSVAIDTVNASNNVSGPDYVTFKELKLTQIAVVYNPGSGVGHYYFEDCLLQGDGVSTSAPVVNGGTRYWRDCDADTWINNAPFTSSELVRNCTLDSGTGDILTGSTAAFGLTVTNHTQVEPQHVDLLQVESASGVIENSILSGVASLGQGGQGIFLTRTQLGTALRDYAFVNCIFDGGNSEINWPMDHVVFYHVTDLSTSMALGGDIAMESIPVTGITGTFTGTEPQAAVLGATSGFTATIPKNGGVSSGSAIYIRDRVGSPSLSETVNEVGGGADGSATVDGSPSFVSENGYNEVVNCYFSNLSATDGTLEAFLESDWTFANNAFDTATWNPGTGAELVSDPFVNSSALDFTPSGMPVTAKLSQVPYDSEGNGRFTLTSIGALEANSDPSNMTNPPNTQATQAALDSIKADCDTLNALGVGTSTITASNLTSQDYEAAFATQKINQDNLNTDNSLGLTLTALPGTFEGNMTALYNNLVAIEAALS